MIASLKLALGVVLAASLAAIAADPAPITEKDFGPSPISAETLDKAAALTVEKLGVAHAKARVIGQYFVPGTKDYPPRFIVSFGPYGSASIKGVETATYIVNLTDGTFRRMEGKPWDKVALRWPSARDALGRLYVSCMHGELAVYDPRDDSLKAVRPIKQSTWLRGVVVGEDGACYVSAFPSGASGRYDPETGETEDYGQQGGPYKIKNIYGYSVGAEGDWVYTASGKVPWFVVALNRKTKAQKILFELTQADFPNIQQRGKEVYVTLGRRDMKTNKWSSEYHKLEGGVATKVEKLSSVPKVEGPWTNIPQPKVRTETRAYPMEDGKAVILYDLPADAKLEEGATRERRMELPYSGEPFRIGRIAPGPDGSLLLSTNPYGDVTKYLPAEARYETLGNPVNKNVYDLLWHREKVWFCGYASSLIGVFEEKGAKVLHSWAGSLGQKHCWHMVVGADKKIYLGCHAEREFVGGALAWYDPETKEAGGKRFPNDDCAGITTALDGQLIVYSSTAVADPMHPDATPPGASLYVYDTAKAEFTQRIIPLPGDTPRGRVLGSAGGVIEAAPGVILGFTTWQGKPRMYLADAMTGEVLKRANLPAPPKGEIVKGPDGMVYAFLGDVLCRIEPKTLAFTAVGNVPGAAGRMAFSGKDLYMTGDIELRRVKGVAR